MPHAHYLSPLLEPRSLVVVGVAPDPDNLGQVVLRNLLAGGFKGALTIVGDRAPEVLGKPCLSSLDKLPQAVDLALLAGPPALLPEVIEQCTRRGIRQVAVLTHPQGASLLRRMREAARSGGVRLLGPKSLGVIRPSRALNASVAASVATAGEVALVCQSGAMGAAVVDWATSNGVGLSLAVALGSAVDIDFGEVLDFLVHDDRTRFILLHIERLREARGFLSALRSAARVKPVILLKSGDVDDYDDSISETENHERAIVRDAVFETAVRRAGVVRVHQISELFYAAKALASGFSPRGNRLAIISNGTGPGAMAVDCARELAIPLAQIGDATRSSLKPLLTQPWSGRMPIDLGGEATPDRYLQTLAILADDPAVDATLVVLSPLALADPPAVAQGIVDFARARRVTLCCCFMGGERIAEARRILEDAGIPVFRTPDTVITLFHHISTYHRNQELLLQVPAGADPTASASGNGRRLVEAVLAERRDRLGTLEARSLLRGFGIAVPPTMLARSATEAMFAAEQLGLPVVLRPDAGGQPRGPLLSVEAVRATYAELATGALTAVAVEAHRPRPQAREVAIAVYLDAVFGPVIQFGAGHHQAEVFRDRAVALPPLNRVLARDLIDKTRFARTLDAFLGWPAADRTAVESALLAVSNLVCELPWIKSLEIDPLLADDAGVLATDVTITLDHTKSSNDRYAHMAIHPYPAQLCQQWPLRDGTVVEVRPVRPEDALLEQAFVAAMSDEARYFRFMDGTRELPERLIARLTQVDYDREMALVALIEDAGQTHQIGSARYAQTPDGQAVEFALAVADRWQGSGLGRRLMEALIDCARRGNYQQMVGDVLADNQKMLRLMSRLGFAIERHPDGGSLKRVVKALAV